MLFKPKWYYLLRLECRPQKSKIARLEILRKQYNIPHDYFMALVLSRPTTAIQLQKALLEQARKEKPNAPEKELWKTVLRSRLSTAVNTGFLLESNDVLNVLKIDINIAGKNRDVINKELREKIDKIVEKITKKCESFEDVCKYIVELDQEINKYQPPSPGEKIIDEILEDKDTELQENLKISNFIISIISIIALIIGVLLFVITKSLTFIGILFLIIGLFLWMWYSSNIKKGVLYKPMIFNNFKFIISFPKFYTSLIIIGIVLILTHKILKPSGEIRYYKQYESKPNEMQKKDYSKSREAAIRNIENLPEGDIKNLSRILLLITDFESRTKKYIAYANNYMKWDRWTKRPTADKNLFLQECNSYQKDIQQFLNQSEIIYRNTKSNEYKKLIKPFLEYFKVTTNFVQQLTKSYTGRSYEETITLAKKQEKINLEWHAKIKPLILKIFDTIANERKK